MTFHHTSTFRISLLSLRSLIHLGTTLLPLTQTWQRQPMIHLMKSLRHSGSHIEPHRTLFLNVLSSLLLFLFFFIMLLSIQSLSKFFNIKTKFWSLIFHTLPHYSIVSIVFYITIFNFVLKTLR